MNKLHVYVVLQCASGVNNEAIVHDVFLQRDLAENRRKKLQEKTSDIYFAVLKKTLKGAKSKKLIDAYKDNSYVVSFNKIKSVNL